MKRLLFLAGLAVLLVACTKGSAPTSEVENKVHKPSAPWFIRYDFDDLQPVKDLAWKFDDQLISKKNKGVIKTEYGKHKIALAADGQKADFNIDSATDLPLFVKFRAYDNGALGSVFAAKKEPTTTLVIKSEPRGALAFIDRHAVGATPLAVGLIGTEHEVEVILTDKEHKLFKTMVKAQNKPLTEQLFTMEPLAPGESFLNTALERPLSSLTIETPDSPGAKIFINGIDVKLVTPQVDLPLPIGPYVVILERADGARFKFATELVFGKKAVISENIKDREPQATLDKVIGFANDGQSDVAAEQHHHHHHHHHHHQHGHRHGH